MVVLLFYYFDRQIYNNLIFWQIIYLRSVVLPNKYLIVLRYMVELEPDIALAWAHGRYGLQRSLHET